jgi:hypothetical protein
MSEPAVGSKKLSHPDASKDIKRPVSPKAGGEHHSKRLKSDLSSESLNLKLPPDLPPSPKLVVGISRSAMASRKLKQSMMDGSFQVNPNKQHNYEEEICTIDRDTAFRYGSTWSVYHSRCAKWYTMSEAYNTTKFKIHAKGCKASPGKTSTMTAWVKKLGWKVNEKTSSRPKDMGSDTASALKIPHLPTVDEVVEQHLKPPHYLPCPLPLSRYHGKSRPSCSGLYPSNRRWWWWWCTICHSYRSTEIWSFIHRP